MIINALAVSLGKKMNDFGIRGTGRIYRQCKRCREVIEKGRERRKLKQSEKSRENKTD